MNQPLPARHVRLALALAALLAAPAALAQQLPARLKEINGNVLVSKDAALGAAQAGLPLTEGTRVITTTGAGALVVYEDGCEVRLKENERFEVETGKPCAALVALTTAAPQPAVGVIGLASSLLPGGLAGAGSYALINQERGSSVASPN